jgi:hypothetical protein
MSSLTEESWREITDRGIDAQERYDYSTALQAFLRAVELSPNNPITQNNLGNIYHRLGRDAEAEVYYRRALELNPKQVEVVCNLGTLARDSGEFQQALDFFEQALTLDPNHDKSRTHRGMTRLTLGDFSGWDDYDSRCAAVHNRLPKSLEWQGDISKERTLVVLTEQALGDEIMFASVYADLIARGINLIVLCSPRLERLFQRSFTEAIFIGASSLEEFAAKGRDYPFDAWCLTGGICRFLRRSRDSFQSHQGFLSRDNDRVEAYRHTFKGDVLKVGISWAGGMFPEQQRVRSIPLEAWRPILKMPGVQFVSLQPGNVEPDLKALGKTGRQIRRPGASPLGDMADYADFVASLDLIITVDNTLAHVGGALGIPTWMLTPKVANWRWGIHATENPWYPSVRMIRQSQQYDWQPVIETVAAELQQLATAKSDGPVGSLLRAG